MKKQNQLEKLISERRYYEKEILGLSDEIKWYNENQTAPYPLRRPTYWQYDNQTEQAFASQYLNSSERRLYEINEQIKKYERKNGRK